MYFKKIAIFAAILIFSGCEEKEVDQKLLKDLWQETARITELPSDAPMPKIDFLKEDLYRKLIANNCAKYDKASRGWKHCVKKQGKLDEKVKTALGQARLELYKKYAEIEQMIVNENCGEYEIKEIKKQCKKDQYQLSNSKLKTLGRAFLSDQLIEIYIFEIIGVTPRSFTFKEGEVYFYSTVAHEFLHIALYGKNVPANTHHAAILKSKNLEQLIDFLSARLKLKNNNDTKECALNSLKLGAERNEMEERSLKRLR